MCLVETTLDYLEGEGKHTYEKLSEHENSNYCTIWKMIEQADVMGCGLKLRGQERFLEEVTLN